MKNKIKYDLVLKNGRLVLPNLKIEELDIGIKDSKIKHIGNVDSKEGKNTINLKHLHVLPGCIDSQVHFREPGLTHKEDINSGTLGAVLGGITGIFEMPNTIPPTITENDFKYKVKLASKKSYCDFSFFIGAAVENINQLKYLEKLPGCCGIKIFAGSSTGSLLIEDDESLESIFLSSTRKISVHSEDENRLKERKYIIQKQDVKVKDHEVWRDVEAALKSTKRLIYISKKTNRKIHILHISTKEELDIIKKNKALITAEATPQHLFFDSPNCYKDLGTLVQMNPPIRGEKHRNALWKGINEKTIDIIGSDHAPHTIDEKKNIYPKSPSGITGVQTLVPIMLNFVNKKKLSLNDFVRLTSSNPAKIFNIKNKGFIEIDYDADFTIVDLKKQKIIDNKWIASKSGWTPYDGVKVKGWPILTIIRGQIIMKEDSVIGEPKGEKISFLDT